MFIVQYFPFFGGIIGFIFFIINLESDGMKNVIYRNNRFTFGGIIKYIKSPFHQGFLWFYPQLWKYNWILMTSIGSIFGFILKFIF